MIPEGLSDELDHALDELIASLEDSFASQN